MKKATAFLLTLSLILIPLLLSGCQSSDVNRSEDQSSVTVIELDEDNYWKYFNVSCDDPAVSSGEKKSISYEIAGVLDFALYEDVVFSFDVIYYTIV